MDPPLEPPGLEELPEAAENRMKPLPVEALVFFPPIAVRAVKGAFIGDMPLKGEEIVERPGS
jgi:hypothetical protein